MLLFSFRRVRRVSLIARISGDDEDEKRRRKLCREEGLSPEGCSINSLLSGYCCSSGCLESIKNGRSIEQESRSIVSQPFEITLARRREYTMNGIKGREREGDCAFVIC